MNLISSPTFLQAETAPSEFWPTQACASPPKVAATYGDFVEAMRRGEVVAARNLPTCAISRLERTRNWAISSFDFGRLLDQCVRGNLFHRLPLNEGFVFEALKEDAAYICSVGPERRLLVVRWGVSDYLNDDDGPRFYYYRKIGDGPWVSADGSSDEWKFFWAVALYLLQNPRQIVSDSDPSSVAHANRRRRMAGKPSLPSTLTIRLTRRTRKGPAPSTWATGTGSPKCPHRRQGHFRRLRDGRVVSVKACRIHGEPVAPVNFVVRP